MHTVCKSRAKFQSDEYIFKHEHSKCCKDYFLSWWFVILLCVFFFPGGLSNILTVFITQNRLHTQVQIYSKKFMLIFNPLLYVEKCHSLFIMNMVFLFIHLVLTWILHPLKQNKEHALSNVVETRSRNQTWDTKTRLLTMCLLRLAFDQTSFFF